MKANQSTRAPLCRMGVLLFLFGGCSLIIAINSANAMSKRGHWQAEKLSPVKQAEYLNTVEKEIILHLNMARTDPEQYAKKYIAPRTRYFAGNIYHDPENPYYKKGYRTREGILAVQECVNVMQNAQPAVQHRRSRHQTSPNPQICLRDQFRWGIGREINIL